MVMFTMLNLASSKFSKLHDLRPVAVREDFVGKAWGKRGDQMFSPRVGKSPSKLVGKQEIPHVWGNPHVVLRRGGSLTNSKLVNFFESR